MSEYQEFIENCLGVKEDTAHPKYCEAGHSFCLCNEMMKGVYWFYEAENFIIDIRDFFLRKELVYTELPDIRRFMSLSSSYIITANGESFSPYQNLSANSLYVLDVENIDKNYRFLLHANSPYLGIGIHFREQMIEDCLSSIRQKRNASYAELFLEAKTIITRALEPIARDILNCRMPSPAAELFFEAKTKEWIRVIIDALLNRGNAHISATDDKALENVADYLNYHYALHTPQEILEKISMMSGTKLKKLFRQKYHSSITEYSQRKRMNIAETLLLNSSLRIQDIAKAVGYSSHSRFSACFKKYKGIRPREMRRFVG